MDKKDSIVIHNIKNPNYRQIHVDGAHGGLTPSGYLNLNFYSQRRVIPKGTEFAVSNDGSLTPIKDVEGSKSGIVREFEFGVYMDMNACQNLKVFLEQQIGEFKKLSDSRDK